MGAGEPQTWPLRCPAPARTAHLMRVLASKGSWKAVRMYCVRTCGAGAGGKGAGRLAPSPAARSQEATAAALMPAPMCPAPSPHTHHGLELLGVYCALHLDEQARHRRHRLLALALCGRGSGRAGR